MFCAYVLCVCVGAEFLNFIDFQNWNKAAVAARFIVCCVVYVCAYACAYARVRMHVSYAMWCLHVFVVCSEFKFNLCA